MGKELSITPDCHPSLSKSIVLNNLSVNEFKFLFDIANRDMIITKIEGVGERDGNVYRAEIESRRSMKNDKKLGLVVFVQLERDQWFNLIPKGENAGDDEYVFYNFEKMFDVITNKKYYLIYA